MPFNLNQHEQLTLTDPRSYWKPFRYPELYELGETHRQMNWTINEVRKIGQDIKDWKVLDPKTKAIYKFLLLYFTQADVDVAGSYFENLSKWYTQPEQRYWLARVIDREATHVQCYDMLPEQFGIDKEEYCDMLEIDAIYDQRIAMTAVAQADSFEDRVLTLTKHICGEGINIYGIFLMLINAQRHGQMMALGQEVVAWSARDENQHVEGLTWLLNKEIQENPELLTKELVTTIVGMFELAVERGVALAKRAYQEGELLDLTVDQIEVFLMQVANARIGLLHIGIDKLFSVPEEVLPQVGLLFAGSSLVNFFEAANTNYAVGTLQGEWEYPESTFKTNYDIEQEILHG